MHPEIAVFLTVALGTTIARSAVLCDVTIVYFDTVYVSLFETEIRLKALDTGLCLFYLS